MDACGLCGSTEEVHFWLPLTHPDGLCQWCYAKINAWLNQEDERGIPRSVRIMLGQEEPPSEPIRDFLRRL